MYIISVKTTKNELQYIGVRNDSFVMVPTITNCLCIDTKDEAFMVFSKLKFTLFLTYHDFVINKSKSDVLLEKYLINEASLLYLDFENGKIETISKTDKFCEIYGYEVVYNFHTLYDYSIHIKTNGEINFIEPLNKTNFTAEELHKYVDGYIEIVVLPVNGFMVVDEEGVIKNKPFNSLATYALSILFRNYYVSSDIYGDVVICSAKLIK